MCGVKSLKNRQNRPKLQTQLNCIVFFKISVNKSEEIGKNQTVCDGWSWSQITEKSETAGVVTCKWGAKK